MPACILLYLIFKQNFALSHIPQRQEKDCLNCGTIVQGRYCHKCGQENVVPKESFWHMVTHFVYDITHFDSNFFTTLKDLIFKPGFLSREYMKGRRASYLHPIKMYVFTSAIFFLLFFSVFTNSESVLKMSSPNDLSGTERLKVLADIENEIRDDSVRLKADSSWEKKLAKLEQMKDTTRPVSWDDFNDLGQDMVEINISGTRNKYKTVEEYDSIQKTLPKVERDGWFRTRLIRKELNINNKFRANPKAAAEKLSQSVLHKLPYMLFVSLPLFALILKLLYIRRKQFYYADHGVFTIHLYIFSFILLLIVFSMSELRDMTGWNFMGWVIGILILGLFVYLYRAMKVFYGQRWHKTLVKFLLTAAFSLLMMVILLAIFFFFSAYAL
jgi:hypothetical protein